MSSGTSESVSQSGTAGLLAGPRLHTHAGPPEAHQSWHPCVPMAAPPLQIVDDDAALCSATLPLPAGFYGRHVVPAPTYYVHGHAAPASATACSLPPFPADMTVWVDELLQTGDVSTGHTPWTTVIVQWAPDEARQYLRGGAVQWDLDFFAWRAEAPNTISHKPCFAPLPHVLRHPAPSRVVDLPARPLLSPGLQPCCALLHYVSAPVQGDLQFDGEHGMWDATCKTFWDIFWQRGFAALAAADVQQKLPLLQKLSKLGARMLHQQKVEWSTMLKVSKRHLERKAYELLQNASYRDQELQGRIPPRAPRPEFVQDTSTAAVMATAEAMKRRLQELGMQPSGFGEQILQRYSADNPYTFADFAFAQWRSWTPEARRPVSAAARKRQRTCGM